MTRISIVFALLTLALVAANYRRVKLFNWDHTDVGNWGRLEKFSAQPQPCEDGWIHFADSCYWIEKAKLRFSDAEAKCFAKNATLMVVNSQDEWNTVRQHYTNANFYWIGLLRKDSIRDEDFPVWQTEGGVSPAKMKWLVEPYQSKLNGWSFLAQYVAHYSSIESWNSSYLYYYPRIYEFGSVCERNNTILDFLARKFDVQ